MKFIHLEKPDTIIIKESIKEFLNPDYIYIPLNNNKLKYNQNDYVYKDDYLFLNNYNITSPISGNIFGLKNMFIDGKNQKCLVIKNDFREKRNNFKRKSLKNLTYSFLLESLKKDKNLLNKFKSIKQVDNIIINIIEDEPYSKTNIMLFKENLNDILNLIEGLRILYNCKKCNIYLKDCDSSIIEECISTIGTYPFINISLADDLYLLEKEFAFKEYFKVDVRNSLYLNIREAIDLYDLLTKGVKREDFLVSIGGINLKEKGEVVKIKKGTSLKELLKNYTIKNDSTIMINGLMQGNPLLSDDVIIDDAIKIILIIPNKKIRAHRCINCGRCVNICPMGINPLKENNSKNSKCIHCGLCNYVCPCYINIKNKVR